MLMLIYTIAAMAVTPIAYEFINRRVNANGVVSHAISGWPSYVINLIVCGAIGLIAMFLPGGWELSLWNWIILTALIYFGNQFVYNTIVKPFFRSNE